MQSNDLYETLIPKLNEEAEIVFANQVFSQKAKEKFSMTAPIAERTYESGTLPVHYFYGADRVKKMQQILFDDFVLADERHLQVDLEAYEIDRNLKYKVAELSMETEAPLGNTSISLDLVNGIYKVKANGWQGHIKVEVVKM